MPKYVDTVAVEQAAAKNWDNSAAIRTEFRGNKSAYIAYWKAVARGQTPAPRQASAPQQVASVPPAPVRAAPQQPAAALRSVFSTPASKMAGIRAFYANDPAEAKKQYPKEVKQLEEAKANGYV